MNYIIVLGKYLNNDGSMSLELRERCYKGYSVYTQIADAKIIVSGGLCNKKANRTESKAMKEYLEKLGVPSENIVEENQSRNTFENALYCNKILKKGYESAYLVSSSRHIFRLLYNPIYFFRYYFRIKPKVCPALDSNIELPNGYIEGRENLFVVGHNQNILTQFLSQHTDQNVFVKVVGTKTRESFAPKVFLRNQTERLAGYIKDIYQLKKLKVEHLG